MESSKTVHIQEQIMYIDTFKIYKFGFAKKKNVFCTTNTGGALRWRKCATQGMTKKMRR